MSSATVPGSIGFALVAVCCWIALALPVAAVEPAGDFCAAKDGLGSRSIALEIEFVSTGEKAVAHAAPGEEVRVGRYDTKDFWLIRVVGVDAFTGLLEYQVSKVASMRSPADPEIARGDFAAAGSEILLDGEGMIDARVCWSGVAAEVSGDDPGGGLLGRCCVSCSEFEVCGGNVTTSCGTCG